MARHECKYWEVNARHHYRHCGFCGRFQYDYTGEWKDEIRLARFVDKWTGGMGGHSGDYSVHLTVNVALPFEAYTTESWNDTYQIVFPAEGRFFKDRTFGWYRDLNEADAKLSDIFKQENPDKTEWTATPH